MKNTTACRVPGEIALEAAPVRETTPVLVSGANIALPAVPRFVGPGSNWNLVPNVCPCPFSATDDIFCPIDPMPLMKKNAPVTVSMVPLRLKIPLPFKVCVTVTSALSAVTGDTPLTTENPYLRFPLIIWVLVICSNALFKALVMVHVLFQSVGVAPVIDMEVPSFTPGICVCIVNVARVTWYVPGGGGLPPKCCRLDCPVSYTK